MITLIFGIKISWYGTQTHTHMLHFWEFRNDKRKEAKFRKRGIHFNISRYSDIWFDRVRITQRLLIKHYGTHGHINQFLSYLPTLCAIHDRKRGSEIVIGAFYQRFLFCSLCFSCSIELMIFFSRNSTRSLSITLVALLLHITHAHLQIRITTINACRFPHKYNFSIFFKFKWKWMNEKKTRTIMNCNRCVRLFPIYCCYCRWLYGTSGDYVV